MIIRKLFKFENAHRVYGAWSKKCSTSIHGHSYKVELFLESDEYKDNSMIIDFGRIKELLDPVIDAFDHSICFSYEDPPDYVEAVTKASERWVQLPCTPTAEELSRVLYMLFTFELKKAYVDSGIKIRAVRVHETDTGYAECDKEDAYNCKFGYFDWTKFQTSEAIAYELEL